MLVRSAAPPVPLALLARLVSLIAMVADLVLSESSVLQVLVHVEFAPLVSTLEPVLMAAQTAPLELTLLLRALEHAVNVFLVSTVLPEPIVALPVPLARICPSLVQVAVISLLMAPSVLQALLLLPHVMLESTPRPVLQPVPPARPVLSALDVPQLAPTAGSDRDPDPALPPVSLALLVPMVEWLATVCVPHVLLLTSLPKLASVLAWRAPRVRPITQVLLASLVLPTTTRTSPHR